MITRSLRTIGYLTDPLGWFERRERRHGADFFAETWPYGAELFLTTPDLARTVLAAPDMLGGRANVALRHAVGEQSVSSLDGPEHTQRRRLLVPAIAAGRAALDAGTSFIRMHRALEAACPVGETIELGPLLRGAVMEAMLEAVFGTITPSVRELGRSFARLVDRGAIPFAQLGILPAFRRDWPLSPWRSFVRELAAVDTQLATEITRAQDHGGMLAALRDALDPRALRDETFTLLGAGYETTATSLAWALEAILLRREIAALSAGQDDALVKGAILESLRLRPTLPTIRRVSESAVYLKEDLLVPAGQSIVLAVHRLHHKEIADPERFDPWRSDNTRSFFAFGGGRRKCPGMALALDHMHGAITALVPELSLVRQSPSRPVFRGATLAPAREIMVRRLGTRRRR